jgi:hypothetical protein
MSSEIILAISTIFLAVFTFVLAFFTFYLWQEAKKSRKYQIELNRPELSVVFEPSKKYINFLYINIKNIGRSPIYNLKLNKVEGDFNIPDRAKKLSELSYIKNIKYLRPNQEINQFFMSLHSLKEKIENLKFSMYFEYEDYRKKKYYKRFIFDFSELLDMSQLGDEPIYKIADSLEKIKQDIGHISSGFHKLQVITQTKKEKQEEDKKD